MNRDRVNIPAVGRGAAGCLTGLDAIEIPLWPAGLAAHSILWLPVAVTGREWTGTPRILVTRE
jgi:hypothetical protein